MCTQSITYSVHTADVDDRIRLNHTKSIAHLLVRWALYRIAINVENKGRSSEAKCCERNLALAGNFECANLRIDIQQ